MSAVIIELFATGCVGSLACNADSARACVDDDVCELRFKPVSGTSRSSATADCNSAAVVLVVAKVVDDDVEDLLRLVYLRFFGWSEASVGRSDGFNSSVDFFFFVNDVVVSDSVVVVDCCVDVEAYADEPCMADDDDG